MRYIIIPLFWIILFTFDALAFLGVLIWTLNFNKASRCAFKDQFRFYPKL